MKKLFVLFSFVFILTGASAQQIPNGSFYYWSSFFAPDGWGTWAYAVSFLNGASADSLSKLAVKDTVAGDYPTDSATLRLTVDTISLPSQGLVTLAGFASLGGAFYEAPPTGTGLIFGYMPYVLKPDTLFFDFKYAPAAGFGDTGLIWISLTKFDTLSHSRWQVLSLSIPLTASLQWQRNIAIPLVPYYNIALPDSLAPDSMQIVIYSSVADTPRRGTTLWIDSLHFDASVDPVVTTGIPDLSALRGVMIYPNPADDRLNIAVGEKEVGDNVKLYNVSGQLVYEGRLDRPLSVLDIHALPPGVYTARIYSNDRITVYKGTVTVVH